MFTIIKQKIFANKNSLIKIAIFLGFYFMFSDFAFADVNATGTNADKGIKEIGTKIVSTLTGVNTVIATLLSMMTYLVTLFLSPEWTSGTFFGMTDKFKNLWVFISNFVYLVFAFILIFIAFMNIIGKQGYEFKTSIPKFIIGILMVPISWFFVNFIVSLSSILFVGAMNLPMDSFPGYKTSLDNINVKTNCTIDFTKLTSSEEKKSGTQGNSIYSCEGETKLSEVLNANNSSTSVFGIMYVYTYGVLEIDKYDKIKGVDLKGIRTIGDMVVHVVFGLLFSLVYGILMIALGLALMIRGIRLWIYMILSPLFGLMFFLGKDKGGEGFFQKFNIGEFISLAMVPVYTILALSFGLLFLHEVSKGLGNPPNETNYLKLEENRANGETKLKIENFTLTIKGEAVGTASKEISSAFHGGLGIIGGLILKLFGIVILWGTVMAALRTSRITEAIVEPIFQFGQTVSKAVTSIPQYTPILPGGQSLQSLNTATNTLVGDFQSKMGAERGRKLADSITGRNSVEISNIDDLKRANGTNNNKSDKELNGNIMKYITSNFESIQRNNEYQKQVIEYAKKQGMTNPEISKIDFSDKGKFRDTYIVPMQQKLNGGNLYTKEVAQRWDGGELSVYTGTAIPPKVQDTTEATNIANSSQKTVNTNQVNGTDNNGQVNQGGNNGQNTQTPPTNGNGNP